jgi:hypothetical protein
MHHHFQERAKAERDREWQDAWDKAELPEWGGLLADAVWDKKIVEAKAEAFESTRDHVVRILGFEQPGHTHAQLALLAGWLELRALELREGK